MGTVWATHTGGRSSAVRTVIDDNVIRCTIEDADGVSAESRAYCNDASAAIRRIMNRRVQGFIAKHDAKTDTTTETFILERPRAVL